MVLENCAVNWDFAILSRLAVPLLPKPESDAASTKHREKNLQDKLDKMVEKCHQAELKAAVAETKAAEYNKRENRVVKDKKK